MGDLSEDTLLGHLRELYKIRNVVCHATDDILETTFIHCKEMLLDLSKGLEGLLVHESILYDHYKIIPEVPKNCVETCADLYNIMCEGAFVNYNQNYCVIMFELMKTGGVEVVFESICDLFGAANEYLVSHLALADRAGYDYSSERTLEHITQETNESIAGNLLKIRGTFQKSSTLSFDAYLKIYSPTPSKFMEQYDHFIWAMIHGAENAGSFQNVQQIFLSPILDRITLMSNFPTMLKGKFQAYAELIRLGEEGPDAKDPSQETCSKEELQSFVVDFYDIKIMGLSRNWDRAPETNQDTHLITALRDRLKLCSIPLNSNAYEEIITLVQDKETTQAVIKFLRDINASPSIPPPNHDVTQMMSRVFNTFEDCVPYDYFSSVYLGELWLVLKFFTEQMTGLARTHPEFEEILEELHRHTRSISILLLDSPKAIRKAMQDLYCLNERVKENLHYDLKTASFTENEGQLP